MEDKKYYDTLVDIPVDERRSSKKLLKRRPEVLLKEL